MTATELLEEELEEDEDEKIELEDEDELEEELEEESLLDEAPADEEPVELLIEETVWPPQAAKPRRTKAEKTINLVFFIF